MTSSCLFKLSLLVMEVLQSLEADKKCTNFPCQFLFLPQERWKFRLLATFVSVQCLTEDSSQRENPKVSFLLGESLRLLLSQNWLLNFAPCRWRTAREYLKCPRCTSLAHNRYLRGSSVVVFFLGSNVRPFLARPRQARVCKSVKTPITSNPVNISSEQRIFLISTFTFSWVGIHPHSERGFSNIRLEPVHEALVVKCDHRLIHFSSGDPGWKPDVLQHRSRVDRLLLHR